MAYKKKITGKQFCIDCINFELKKYGIDFDYLMSLPKRPYNKEEIIPNIEYQDDWFRRYKFDSFEEYMAFKEYFYEHFKDYAPQREWRKIIVDREFEWFNLQYGLSYNYDFDDHIKRKKEEDDVFKKIYGKKKKPNNFSKTHV